MKDETTVDSIEVKKFTKLANTWWDKEGPLKTLHDINPIRLEYIEKICSVNGKRVLDIGCGGGVLSTSIAKLGGNVSGIDVAESAILVAKERAKLESLHINYDCVPVENYIAEPFQVITCLEMLEHVNDPEMVLKNAKRLLIPGGYLFLSTINRTVTAYFGAVIAAEYILNIIPKQTHDYNKFIKPSEMCGMLRENGFEILDLTGLNYNPLTRKATLTDSLNINY